MDQEELKNRMSAILEKHYSKDENGLFYDEIYVDYRDEISEDTVKELLSSEDPMQALSEKMNEWFWEARMSVEDQAIDKLREDSELDAVFEEDEELFRDALFNIFYVNEPFDHYLDQNVDLNIVLDTGDCNYEFVKNNFDHGEVDECSSLLWLCRQQGVTKEELEQALQTGECYPKHISDLLNRNQELLKEMKALGYVPNKPKDQYNQKGAFKTLFHAKDLVDNRTRIVERYRANLSDCDLSYKEFCDKWFSIPTNKANGRNPPSEEKWKRTVDETRPRIVANLALVEQKLANDKAHLEEVLKDPNVARAAQLLEEFHPMAQPYHAMTQSEEYKKCRLLESVIRESQYTTTSMNALAALVKMPLRDAIRLNEVIQAEKSLNDSYIPEERKGKSSILLDQDAVLGLYDAWTGAGGFFEIELAKPLEIPVRFIHDANVDGSLGYGIQSIYGGMEYSESLKDIREVPPELTKKPLDQVLQEAQDTVNKQQKMSQEEIKNQCLAEALEENDLMSVSMEMGKEVVSQMGNGLLAEPLASEFRACVLEDRPEWDSYSAFEMGSILFHDYCERLDMNMEPRSLPPER